MLYDARFDENGVSRPASFRLLVAQQQPLVPPGNFGLRFQRRSCSLKWSSNRPRLTPQ
jgi:hypothetical protein